MIEQITRCFINGFRSAGRGIKRDPAGNDPKIGILDFKRDHAALKPLFPQCASYPIRMAEKPALEEAYIAGVDVKRRFGAF